MYLNYYGIKREPFQITPDPSFLFLSLGHREALASIIYGVEKKKGFILILGPVGVGKTTILRAYLEKVDKQKLKTIYVFNANISYNNLLKQVLRELEIPAESDETSGMVTQLHRVLLEEYRQQRNVLLLIDEAQNMPVDTLENLRMLSNFETTTDKLIQVVFSAQPEFEKTLNLQELKQLKQRVAVKTIIYPLTAKEGITYVKHRLQEASDKELTLFTPRALKEIVGHAKGIPRVINILCDNCLITAYGYGKKKVGVSVVREILRDFGLGRRYSSSLLLIIPAVLLLFSAYTTVKTWTPLTEISSGSTGTMKLPGRKVASRVLTHTSTPSVDVTYIHKIIERGDTLAKLIIDVYGHVDKNMIRLVKKANPHINDENVIIEGGEITFPVKGRSGR
jgi:general secretion pathway protein A